VVSVTQRGVWSVIHRPCYYGRVYATVLLLSVVVCLSMTYVLWLNGAS